MHFDHHIEFLTATILNWQQLLQDDNCKKIVTSSLEWLVKNERCKVFGFVIMPNHLHLLWQINETTSRTEAQAAFFSFTGHQFEKYLRAKGDGTLEKHFVSGADRKYQFWERDHMIKPCWSKDFMLQKLTYIHNNPCQPHWLLAPSSEDYQWSSASFYILNDERFAWLTHLTV